MSEVAIRVENLSKRYEIGAAKQRYDTLRDQLADGFKALLTRNGFGHGRTESIWALKDVSFEVHEGEVVGIIGRNGAGKSTLLKILTQITKPTTGYAEIHGRTGSLLEVGTGFHPELSGRENIYLNGAILGMKKCEIDRKFDQIVGFAELAKFIDTPVKRYSSGMYVRLAFAVAAHLDPEILIVDEVLAVGDSDYQRRCLNRMSTLASSGKTVLVVSHNMDIIPRLCTRTILLQGGQIKAEGSPEDIVERYLGLDTAVEEEIILKPRTGDGRARFSRLQILDRYGNIRVCHACGDDLILRMEVISEEDIQDVALAVVLKTALGNRLITSWTREVDFPVDLHKGIQTFQCRFENVKLRPGRSIAIDLWMEASSGKVASSGGLLDFVEYARLVPIVDSEDMRHFSTERYQGIVLCSYSWSQVSGQ